MTDGHAATNSIPSSYSGGRRFPPLPRDQLNDVGVALFPPVSPD